MGCGSTGLAALKEGRTFIGMEIDKEYFEKGCERFDRECNGIVKTKDGRTFKQTTLFEL